MIYVLYNPKSGNGHGEETAHQLDNFQWEAPLTYQSIIGLGSYEAFFAALKPEDILVICGGDGTLNRFINDTEDLKLPDDIRYFGCGTGNDFLRDLGVSAGSKPVKINDYLKNLPTVIVKGKSYRFLNNVGFGIDGYCTQVGDEMREAGKENINYAGIAIKGILGGFKPVNATVTVDGITEHYKKAWLAPTMKGRFYGGGMMPTPAQDRNDPDGTLSVMTFFGWRKLAILMAFPSIFQGEHIKHTNMVQIRTGKYITVQFDRPCPLQIDGETVRDVTEYSVYTGE